MSIVLQGSTSGSVTLQEPAVAGTTVLTLPAVSGTVLTSASTITPSDGSVTQAKLATGVAGTGPAFSAYATVGTAITGGVSTKINQDTEEFDTNNNFASSRFTPTVAGYYQINCGTNVPASNYASAHIAKNGSLYKSGSNGSGAVNSSYVSSIVYLNGSTDYVEFWFTDGSSVTTGTGQENSYFNGAMVRSA
jgi:hypothetical protein